MSMKILKCIKLTQNQRMQIWQKYGGRCAYCGEPIEYKDMQVDHIKPIFRGWSDSRKQDLPEGVCGDDSMENLNPSCRMCNFRKGTDTIELFRNAIKHSLVCLERSFTYRLAKRYGLVKERSQNVEFYFEVYNREQQKLKSV